MAVERNERERILNAVNILITAWRVDHKDWREFDVGYTSALEQVAGMIQKDLTPESASESWEGVVEMPGEAPPVMVGKPRANDPCPDEGCPRDGSTHPGCTASEMED